jgi:phage gp46-like protein
MTENLTNALRLEIEEAVRDCLAWMVSEGVAKSVDAEATIPEPDQLTLTVTIEQPEGTTTLKYNLNWSAMRGRVGA